MAHRPRNLVAMAHVQDVRRSIAFYETLGFVVEATHSRPDAGSPVWAHLESGNAQLMLAIASEPIDPANQDVLFYIYFDDIQATHAALAAKGLAVGELTYPFYCPKGEFRLMDPDGYCLMLTHV